MEGLAVKAVSSLEVLNNKDERIDSDFWTMEPDQNPNLHYEKIGKHLCLSQYGASITMNDEGVGTPIYRMNEIHNMMCDLNIAKFADLDEKELKQLTLAPRDVLFNRTNSYEWVGRTGLFLGHEGSEAVFASYLVRFRTKHDTLLPEYLVAFLNCKYGVADVKRRSRQSINQTNVNPEEVKEIAIPLLSMSIQEEIKHRFEQAFEGQKGASLALQKAEAALLSALGLAGWTPPEPLSYTARAADALSAARLDAQYFMPSKLQMIEALQAMPGSLLGARFKSVREMFDPAKADPDFLVRNFDLPDALNPILDDDKEPVASADIGSLKKTMRNGDVAMSRLRAYLRETAVVRIGTCHLAVGSSEFIVLRPADPKTNVIAPETLMIFLRSAPVQTILKWCQDGSQHPRFSERDLLAIPLPDAVADASTEIEAMVQSAFAARARSRALLSSAKRAVETAIEQGEDAALALLEQNK